MEDRFVLDWPVDDDKDARWRESETYFAHDIFAINYTCRIDIVRNGLLVLKYPQNGIRVDVRLTRLALSRIPWVTEAALFLRDELLLVAPLITKLLFVSSHLFVMLKVSSVDSTIAGCVRKSQLLIVRKRENMTIDLLLDL